MQSIVLTFCLYKKTTSSSFGLVSNFSFRHCIKECQFISMNTREFFVNEKLTESGRTFICLAIMFSNVFLMEHFVLRIPHQHPAELKFNLKN